MKNNFFGKSYITVDQLQKVDIFYLFEKVNEMKKVVETNGDSDELKGKMMTALFFEPSTRTFSSFIVAIQKLGGGFIPLNGANNTSAVKGESFEDTIKVLANYSDVIVLRHPDIGSADNAVKISSVPIINAGDGAGEHPTQAIQDSYTIFNHFSSFEGLNVGMIGDMKNGRTVHSLSKMLVKLGVKKFYWISPKILSMPEEVRKKVQESGANIYEGQNLSDVLKDLDVMYVTRVQKERFSDISEYERLKNAYVITPEILSKAKKNMIVMHPLPRVGEISTEIDSDSRSIYLTEQLRNGLYARMALLRLILLK